MKKIIIILLISLTSLSTEKKIQRTPLEILTCLSEDKNLIKILKNLLNQLESKEYINTIKNFISNFNKIEKSIKKCIKKKEITLKNYNNLQKIEMSNKEFLEIMNTGEKVKAGSKVHLKMIELSNEAMKITSEINSNYKTPQQIRKLMSKLISQELDDNFGLFPPFYTDCGKNIHIGKGVFINSGCKFQDQGGIYIGDNSLIGHNTVIATLNHDINPNYRADTIPKPVKIGKNVWIGSGVIILPGVTIGDNAVIGAGSIVTKDIPKDMIAVGNPAKVIKSIYD